MESKQQPYIDVLRSIGVRVPPEGLHGQQADKFAELAAEHVAEQAPIENTRKSYPTSGGGFEKRGRR